MKSFYFNSKSLIYKIAPFTRVFFSISYFFFKKRTLAFLAKNYADPRSKRAYTFKKITPNTVHQVSSCKMKIQLFEFGSTGPPILLTHGWGDTSHRFEYIIQRLLESGYKVYTFDHIGHGKSQGKSATLFNFILGLKSIINFIEKTQSLHGIITHSMGGLALLNQNASLFENKKFVVIATPTKFFENLIENLYKAGVPKKISIAYFEYLSQKFNLPWNNLHAINQKHKLSENFLFVHDEDDNFTSFNNLIEFLKESPQTKTCFTKGLGHHRIVYDPNTATQILDFL